MAAMVLKCRQCGSIDDTHSYETADQAASQMRHWACPKCAWTEYELVSKTENQPVEASQPQR